MSRSAWRGGQGKGGSFELSPTLTLPGCCLPLGSCGLSTHEVNVAEVVDGDPNRYLTPDGSDAFVHRREVIRVKGRADEQLTVRLSRLGTVISDVHAAAGAHAPRGHVFALSAVALRVDDTTMQFPFEAARARCPCAPRSRGPLSRAAAERRLCGRPGANRLRRRRSRPGTRRRQRAARWTWGAAHQTRSKHTPFGSIALLAPWFDLVTPTGGSNDTVNLGGYAINDASAPFESRYGAGYRALDDLAAPERSRFVISTGQSGHVLSPHYRSMHERWASGRYAPMQTDPAKLLPDALGTLVLQPAPATRY